MHGWTTSWPTLWQGPKKWYKEIVVAKKGAQLIIPGGMEVFQEKTTFQFGQKGLGGYSQTEKAMKGILNVNNSTENWEHVLIGQRGNEGNVFGMVYGTRITACKRSIVKEPYCRIKALNFTTGYWRSLRKVEKENSLIGAGIECTGRGVTENDDRSKVSNKMVKHRQSLSRKERKDKFENHLWGKKDASVMD